MKLLIVTSLSEFHKDILKLFRESHIEAFSTSEIDGYRNSLIATQSWFPSEKGGNESVMLFSFTEDDKIDSFFKLVKEYNEQLETDNPVRAVVLPIERYI